MSLFREEAIRQYMDPDARGGLLKVSPPSGVRIFAVLAALFLLAAIVAVTQSVSVTANGRGVIRPREGVRLVQAAAPGRVLEVKVEVGERVAAGAVLVTTTASALSGQAATGPIADLLAKRRAEVIVLRQAGEEQRADVLAAANADLERALAAARKTSSQDAPTTTKLVAPVAGVVDALTVKPGEVVEAGRVVAKVVPEGQALVAYMAIEGKHRAQLEPGRRVRLKLDEHPSEEAGFGTATVRRISRDAMGATLSDPLLASSVASAAAPMYQLELELESMPPRAEGGFENGMAFTGEVVLREQRIIALLFPPLARLFD